MAFRAASRAPVAARRAAGRGAAAACRAGAEDTASEANNATLNGRDRPELPVPPEVRGRCQVTAPPSPPARSAPGRRAAPRSFPPPGLPPPGPEVPPAPERRKRRVAGPRRGPLRPAVGTTAEGWLAAAG